MREIKVKKLVIVFILALAIVNILIPILSVYAAKTSVQLEKTVSKNTVLIGEEFTYTIKYTRPSTTADGQNVKIIDELPSNLEYISYTPSADVVGTTVEAVAGTTRVTFDMGDLKAGKSGILKISARFPAGTTLPTIGGVPNTAVNKAVVTEDLFEQNESNEVTVTPQVLAPNFTIDKVKVIPQGDAVLDQVVTYQIRVTGNSALGGLNLEDVTITDELPANAQYISSDGGTENGGIVTWPATTLQAGQNITKTIKILYPSANFVIADTVINKATVTATPLRDPVDPPTPVYLEDTVTHGFGAPLAGIGNFTKEGRQADDRYSVGQTAQFYLRNIENTGNIPIDSIEITDMIPTDITLTQISTGRYNESCSVSVYYQTDDSILADPTNWIAWGGAHHSPNNIFLNVADLGIGDPIRNVKWEITNGVDGIVPGFTETAGIEVRGTVAMPGVGNTITNNATLKATIGVDILNDNASKTITVIDPDAWITAQKTTGNGSSFNMNDTVQYNLTIQNHPFATGNYTNPVVYDVLPNEVDVEMNAGSVVYIWDRGNSVIALDPVCTLLEDVDFGGGVIRDVIKWEFNGILQPGEYVTIHFDATIKNLTRTGFVTNDLYITSDADPSFENDAELVNVAALSANRLYKVSRNIFVKFIGSMDSQKWVKGELDADWGYFGILNGYGQTLPTGIADYRFKIKNTGANGPISNLVLIDILPYYGDTGVIDTNPRQTVWRPYLVNMITGQDGGPVPAGIKVYYSINPNPSCEELRDPENKTGLPADGWSESPPADITSVRSLKIYFENLVLDSGDEVILEWPMRAPAHAPVSADPVNNPLIAWNSFGYGATYPDVNPANPDAIIQEPFLPSEPKKVGFIVNDLAPASFMLGDFVWEDMNKNGIQDAGEPGINGVLVNLYEEDPLNPGNPKAQPLKYTRTGDDYQPGGNPGLPGYYGFTNLPAGHYFIEFIYPQDYKVTPANAPGSTTDNDSNINGAGQYVKADNGVDKYALMTSQIILAANDTSIDLGLYRLASLGDKVWKDNDADGRQDGGEPGIASITVKLLDGSGNQAKYGDGTDVPDQVTDASGNYRFTGLEPGNYQVRFVNPGGIYKFSNPNTTSEDQDSDTDTDAGNTATSATVFLYSNETNLNMDAGMYLGRIGNYIWDDKDVDGVQDGGEPGISGVTVRLTDSLGVRAKDAYGNDIADYTTGAGGTYVFNDLAPGDYIVEIIDKPASFQRYSPLDTPADDTKDSDFDRTTGKTAVINLTPGERDTSIDCGLYGLANVGNLVWKDNDADGIQDGGEPGIQGVTVRLLDGLGNQAKYFDGTDVPDTVTDASGNYAFTGLEPGEYKVQFTNPGGIYHFSNPNTTGETADSDTDSIVGNLATSVTVFLHSLETNNNMDAGMYLGQIGNFVWEDKDADGYQDGGETGISGVKLRLIDNATGLTAKDAFNVDVPVYTTGAGGTYLFTDLAPGNYIVEITEKPVAYQKYSPPDNHVDDSKDSDFAFNAVSGTQQTAVINLSPGERDMSLDCGIYGFASVGDYVWEDINGNGIQDGGELPLADVTVRLFMQDGVTPVTDGLGNPVAPVITQVSGGATDGQYLFSNLEPGNYIIQFEIDPARDYLFSLPLQGADQSADSNPVPVNPNDSTAQTAIVNLVSRDAITTVDAGFHKAILGDLVWEDLNGDGKQDPGEPGIANVTVKLLDESEIPVNDSGGMPYEVVTDATGKYEFNRLSGGNYKVQFVLPAGYYFSPKDAAAAGSDSADSDPVTTTGITDTIILADGAVDKTRDAGMYRLTGVGDYVWLDLDKDGVQDGGEPGIQGVPVKLLDAGLNEIASQNTGAGGEYLFDNLVPGTYSVKFEPSAFYKITTANAGGNDSTDSDIDNTKTVSVNLVSNIKNLTIDAGLQIDASVDIQKTVYKEHDGGAQAGVDLLSVQVGRNVTYKFVITNTGQTYLNNIRVTDNDLHVNNIPADADPDITYRSGNSLLAPGETLVYYYETTVAGDLTNRADVTASPADGVGVGIPGAVDVTDNDTAQVNAINPAIDLQKTVYYGHDGGASHLGGAELAMGQLGTTITYVFKVTNTGNTNLNNILISDADLGIDTSDLTPIGAVGILAPGGVRYYYYETTILGDLLNTANVIGVPCDAGGVALPDVSSPTDTDTAQVEEVIPGIEVVKTVYKGHDGGAQVGASQLADQAGTAITYVFTVRNTGTKHLNSIKIDDLNLNAPAGIHKVDMTLKSGAEPLAPGSTLVYYYETTLTGDLPNRVDVEGTPCDNLGNPIAHVNKPNHFDIANVYIGASVGNYVWLDTNKDGVQDAAESGIANVKVILKDNLGNTLSETTTDATGKYLFDDLVPGSYVISVDQSTLAGKVQSYELDLTVNNQVAFTLVSGQVKNDVDFGYYTPVIFIPPPLAAVGDLIWEDTNKNGVFDSGESGISNVKVILKDNNGSVVSTTLTNSKGEYQFNSLMPGDYYVSVEKATLPGNFIQTYELDAVMDNSVKVNLPGGSFQSDVDFGYYKIVPPPPVIKNDASVGDYVWYDADGDGIQDASEKGIAKVRVILTDITGKETKVITNSQGKYLFNNLAPGVYIIKIDQATLPKSMKNTYELDKSLNNNVTFMLLQSENKLDVDFGYDFTGITIPEDEIPEGSALGFNLDKVLPKTGVPYFNLLITGFLMTVISSAALVVLRKKKLS